MLSVEWLNSRPYYLNSSSTPFDYLWGGVWFLFGDDDYEQFGPEPSNLGVRLSVSVEAEVCDAPVDFELETVSG